MIVRPAIESYAEEHSSPPSTRLADLAAHTAEADGAPYMMVGPVEGQVLALLVRLLRARRVLEIGTFTGYSTLAMAEALPADGSIVTCELDARRASIARRHIEASPWAPQVDIRVGPALPTIRSLAGPWDFVFVDADKTGYCDYYEAVVPHLAPGALLAVDNTLHLGHVTTDRDTSADAVAIRAFNERVQADPRVEQLVLTIRQGLTLVRRVDG